MAITESFPTGNGTTGPYTFNFPYLNPADVKVSVNGSSVTEFSLSSQYEILFTSLTPSASDVIRIYRQTDDSGLSATFYPGSAIRAQDMNDNFTQNLYVTQESNRDATTAIVTADAATTTANTALSNSNTAVSDAASAVSTANTASTNASAAVATANTAASDAASAVSTANSASADATTALSTANATQAAQAALEANVYDATELDAGQLDNRYYTETELNNGALDNQYVKHYNQQVTVRPSVLTPWQSTDTNVPTALSIDNRFYTKTQLDGGQLDNRYYTETQLDAGQLDNRYYTETEIDANFQKQYPALGSAAAPTYTFIGDTNTGLYSPGADQVAISTNGTGRLFVDANGKVGIGTSTPGSYGIGTSLVIKDSGFGSGLTFEHPNASSFVFRSPSATTAGLIEYNHPSSFLKFYTNSTEKFIINSSGRLGLGTSIPTALLDVSSDVLRLRTAKTPTSATDTGNAGDICWDANYVYVCIATNTWKRSALSTW